MNALTASLDDASVDYAYGPWVVSDADGARTAFEAGAHWALHHVDWRVLAGSVPGRIFVGRMRLGDRVSVSDVEGRVVELVGDQGRVRFTVETDAGKRIKYQRSEMEAVLVLDVGRDG